MTTRLASLLVAASFTMACGPRVSQWIQVKDCAPPHAAVPNARVYVQEMYIEDGRERPHALGHVARGGNTTNQGMTWDSFSDRRRSVALASVRHQNGKISDTEAERQPLTRIPPRPSQPIDVCVNR